MKVEFDYKETVYSISNKEKHYSVVVTENSVGERTIEIYADGLRKNSEEYQKVFELFKNHIKVKEERFDW